MATTAGKYSKFKKGTKTTPSEAEKENEDLLHSLKATCMFSHLSEDELKRLSLLMERKEFKKGDIIGNRQDEPTRALFVITKGKVERCRTEKDGESTSISNHHEFPLKEVIGEKQHLVAFGVLHALTAKPTYATTTALSDGVAWRLPKEQLLDNFKNPHFGQGVAAGLSLEIMRMSEVYRTPLLEQKPQLVNIAAVSVAAAFEAYYRSMMNALLNASLMNQKGAQLFPNMHLQIPTRVLYINGFKATRQWLSTEIRIDDAAPWWDKRGRLLAIACAPGILMTPISGFLEACNAGHSNPEPMMRRSFRGLMPRCVREVIFGVGLNQLSDFFEERVPSNLTTNKVLRNALGSVVAGTVAGYFSHIPHNLSTMKLLAPHVSYQQHFATLVERATNDLPIGLPLKAKSTQVFGVARALLMPQGFVLRSTQIIGSFVLLNGISHLMDIRFWGDQSSRTL